MRWNESQLKQNGAGYLGKFTWGEKQKCYIDYIKESDYSESRKKYVIAYYQNYISTYRFPDDILDHKDYPDCIQCQKKYVPINKGEMICFSCSFTRK